MGLQRNWFLPSEKKKKKKKQIYIYIYGIRSAISEGSFLPYTLSSLVSPPHSILHPLSFSPSSHSLSKLSIEHNWAFRATMATTLHPESPEGFEFIETPVAPAASTAAENCGVRTTSVSRSDHQTSSWEAPFLNQLP